MSESFKKQWPEVIAAGLTGYMQGQESKMQREWMDLQKKQAIETQGWQREEAAHRKALRPKELEQMHYNLEKSRIDMVAAKNDQERMMAGDRAADALVPYIIKKFNLPGEMAGAVKGAMAAKILAELGGAANQEERAQSEHKQQGQLFNAQIDHWMNENAKSAIELLNTKEAREDSIAYRKSTQNSWKLIADAYGLPEKEAKEIANPITVKAAQETLQFNSQMGATQASTEAAKTANEASKLEVEVRKMEKEQKGKFGNLQSAANVMATAGESATDELASAVNEAVGKNAFKAPVNDKALKGLLGQHELIDGLVKTNPQDPNAVGAWKASMTNLLNELGKYGGVSAETITKVVETAQPDVTGQLSTSMQLLGAMQNMTTNPLTGAPLPLTNEQVVLMDAIRKILPAMEKPVNQQAEVERAFITSMPNPEAAQAVLADARKLLAVQNMTPEEYGALLTKMAQESQNTPYLDSVEMALNTVSPYVGTAARKSANWMFGK